MKLKPGESKCEECKGKGKIPSEDNPNIFMGRVGSMSSCPTCQGTGKLDWIEKVIGKKKVNLTITLPPAQENLNFLVIDYVDLIKPTPITQEQRKVVEKIAKEMANKIDCEMYAAFSSIMIS